MAREVKPMQKKIPMIALTVAAGLSGVAPQPAVARDRADYPFETYAQACKSEIAEIPEFSCLDGQIVPITRDGVDSGSSAPEKCDRPPLLRLGGGRQCVPFSRVGTLSSGTKDIQITYVCRRYKERPKGSVYFDDVAIIAHNKKTGATCFFQALAGNNPKTDPKTGKKVRETGLRADHVPPPMRPQSQVPADEFKPADFWLSPESVRDIYGGKRNSGCNICHDSGPWIHTPYIDQVKRRDDPSVPLVPSAPQPYYRFVGAFAGRGWWGTPRYFLPKYDEGGVQTDNKCGNCHRVGIHATSGYLGQAAGGQAADWIDRNLSDWAQEFGNKHWMPPGDGSLDPSAWGGQYGPSLQQLKRCNANPELPECGAENFQH